MRIERESVMSKIISVIVPVYKVEKYLERCIDSILNQTYHNLQIILIDDGSPDDCGRICDEYAKRDARIEVIHKSNGGQAAARNDGLAIAKGDYVGFVDSDDYIEPNMYEEMLYKIQENQADICVCSRYVESENGKMDSYVSKKARETLMDNIQALKHIIAFSDFDMAVWDKLYKADILSELRFPAGKINEDYYFITEAFERSKKIVYIPIPFYHYIQRIGSTTRNSVMDKSIVQASEYLYEFFRKKHPEIAYVGQTACVFAYVYLINKCIKNRIDINDEFREEALSIIRKNWYGVIRNENIGVVKKIQVICLAMSITLYRELFLQIKIIY